VVELERRQLFRPRSELGRIVRRRVRQDLHLDAFARGIRRKLHRPRRLGRLLRRIPSPPRHDWKETAEECGFRFHTIEGDLYWDESARYEFSLGEIERDLEDPTGDLHLMCLDLVDRVVRSEELMERLAIPAEHRDLVANSWRRGDPHLYGRMDLSYDGNGPAKLLELNYDTPTSLYEAAFFQWVWLEQMRERGDLPATADQYNTIQEDLIDVFGHLKALTGATGAENEASFVFSAVRGSEEDKGTAQYLQDLASQAGFKTRFENVEDIGIDALGRFTDSMDEVVRWAFKLYPWEWLFEDRFGQYLTTSPTLWLEPPWKAVLSNKGILPLLWEAHPDHPNLLPAFFESDPSSDLPAGWVRKPLFSREGANIRIHTATGGRIEVDGPYGEGPAIRQAYHPLPNFDGRYALVGSWVVADRPTGIGMREDDTLVTRDSSRFVPHVIV
jgi:glutathionylspermidine synthase